MHTHTLPSFLAFFFDAVEKAKSNPKHGSTVREETLNHLQTLLSSARVCARAHAHTLSLLLSRLPFLPLSTQASDFGAIVESLYAGSTTEEDDSADSPATPEEAVKWSMVRLLAASTLAQGSQPFWCF